MLAAVVVQHTLLDPVARVVLVVAVTVVAAIMVLLHLVLPILVVAAALQETHLKTQVRAALALLSFAMQILMLTLHQQLVARRSQSAVVIASTNGLALVASRSKRGSWLTLHS